jgi:hypothetical protein
MPISRKPATTRRAPRKATPIRVRKTTKRIAADEPIAAPVIEPVVESMSEASAPPVHEQIVNADYKRELIRAHAAMRQPHDPIQMLSVWAGVLATFVVIAGAWWWSMSPGIAGSLKAPWTTGFETTIQQSQLLTTKTKDYTANQAKSLTNDLSTVSARLGALDKQQQTSQDSLQRMATLINSSVTSASAGVVTTSVRPLFRTAPATSTSENPTSTNPF